MTVLKGFRRNEKAGFLFMMSVWCEGASEGHQWGATSRTCHLSSKKKNDFEEKFYLKEWFQRKKSISKKELISKRKLISKKEKLLSCGTLCNVLCVAYFLFYCLCVCVCLGELSWFTPSCIDFIEVIMKEGGLGSKSQNFLDLNWLWHKCLIKAKK